MIPELDTLYTQAIHTRNLTKWLQDDNLIQSYEQSACYSEEGQKKLLEQLTGDNLELFRRYINNQEEQRDAENRMLFSQGLAIDIRLGALTVWP